MKILLLSHIKNRKHLFLIKAINEALLNSGYNIYTEFESRETYDCIIVFNKKNLSKLKSNLSIPVIYIFCHSEITTEYPNNLSSIDRVLIFRDKSINTSLPSIRCTLLNMISPIKSCTQEQITDGKDNHKTNIYVDIDQESSKSYVLLNLLPFLNSIHNYDICCYSQNTLYKSLVNKHIRVINKDEEVDTCIASADIVVGSGTTIMKGIELGKKVIVVGEKGYGGLINTENLENAYKNNFQGRNGGTVNEIIPTNLLFRDIISEIDKDSIKKNKIKQNKLNMAELDLLVESIKSIVNHKQIVAKHRELVKFYLNPDYVLHSTPNNKHILYYRSSGKKYKILNESEAVVLLGFREVCTIQEALNKYPEEYRGDIGEFIDSLMDLKLILPSELK